MPNLWEAFVNMVRPLIDEEPRSAPHVGEVMSMWMYCALLDEAIAFEQAGLNTTENADLREVMQEAVRMCTHQSSILREFLREEGIPIPPVSEPKPRSEPRSVPLGVKLTDSELANGVSLKVASAVTACATTAAQSLRNDIGLMFVRFQAEQLTYGVTLKQLMKKHGWLKVPPYYCPPGAPNSERV